MCVCDCMHVLYVVQVCNTHTWEGVHMWGSMHMGVGHAYMRMRIWFINAWYVHAV